MDADFDEWARSRMRVLLGRAYLLTGHQQSAEDLTQGTLERVASAWRRVDDPDAYSRRVMYRLQVSLWRRLRLTESPAARLPDCGQADETGRVEVRLTLATALGRLTPAQRAVLILRFYEDLTEAATASVLDCSVGNVKSQTHKALAALRRQAPELAELIGRRCPADA